VTLFDAQGRALKPPKPNRTRPEGEPVIETTHAENLAARKFLAFLLGDIAYQLNMLARDTKVSRKQFGRIKVGSLLIAQYLTEQVKELDRVIASIETDPKTVN
jgi:hypothetical protein